MKRIGFLSLILATWYIAAMYKQPALMALALTELFLFVGMFFMSRFFKRRMDVCFEKRKDETVKGKNYMCRVRLENRGWMPAGRLGIRLRYGFKDEEHPGKIRLAAAFSEGKRESTGFSLTASRCGILHMEMDRLWVYDYLSLFRSEKKMEASMQLAVFPPKETMDFSWLTGNREKSGEENGCRPLGDGGEIRQLREYRDGDSARNIHWKQTARSGEIWVKEYDRQEGEKLSLFLSMSDEREHTVEERDRFYTMLAAYLRFVAENDGETMVMWLDKEKGLCQAQVRDEAGIRSLLWELYQTFFEYKDLKKEVRTDYRLDMDLRLWKDGVAVGRLDGKIKTKVGV